MGKEKENGAPSRSTCVYISRAESRQRTTPTPAHARAKDTHTEFTSHCRSPYCSDVLPAAPNTVTVSLVWLGLAWSGLIWPGRLAWSILAWPGLVWSVVWSGLDWSGLVVSCLVVSGRFWPCLAVSGRVSSCLSGPSHVMVVSCLVFLALVRADEALARVDP